MPFTKRVEIGRVALVNLAEDELYNRLVVIVDIVDQNRVRVHFCPSSFSNQACHPFSLSFNALRHSSTCLTSCVDPSPSSASPSPTLKWTSSAAPANLLSAKPSTTLVRFVSLWAECYVLCTNPVMSKVLFG
jgi:hypothetical protein